jgi:hypothetical protein
MSEAKESFSIKLQLLIFQNPYPIGVRVAKHIENTDLISASFIMLFLISIVVYGNSD